MRTIAGIIMVVLVASGAAFLSARSLQSDFVPTFLGVLSASLAAISALGIWFTVREMRADRIERTRPYVLVDFPMTHNQAIYCAVRNLGSGAARDISLTFDPVPIDHRGTKLTEVPFFQRPVPLLPPGAEVHQLFHVGCRLYAEEVPRRFKATVSYRGEGQMRYSDVFDIDLELYRGVTVPPKTTEEHLATLGDSLDKLVITFERIIVRLDSLIVETPRQFSARIRELHESSETAE